MNPAIVAAGELMQEIRSAVHTVLVGQERLLERLLVALLANGHVLVEGMPGLAKTTAIRALAAAAGGDFARVQFTPDLLPADVLGTMIYDPRDHSFSLTHGPVFATLLLADEVNRAPAKVQSALLEAMQERQVSIGGHTHPLPDPFLVMATQNPIEQEGTYPLPEAQMDRFLLKLVLGYPRRDEEEQVIERMAHPDVPWDVPCVADPQTLRTARRAVDSVHLDERLRTYVLDLVFASRPGHREQLSDNQRDVSLGDFEGLIAYGASPRAGLALVTGSRALALLRGRDYVLPDDVQDLAPDVLRHRIVPTYEAEAEELSAEALVLRLLETVRTP